MEAISTAAERAASLTHQLLAFSRQQVLQPRVIDLNAAVTETKKMLTRMIGEDIEIVAKLDPELGNVKADPGQIHQVVMNLGVNARDAMPKGGRLLLETRNVDISELDARARDGLRPGAYVMLAARDNGVGMDDEVASHIFEPFFTTKEHSSGTGLGLSTVYGIVKQSGGYVDVTSTPGDGSVFEILLPRVNDRVHAVTKLEGQRKEGTGTILLVEDDEAVRALAHDILSSHGYSILQASDGAMALRLLDEHCDEIGLMITDLVMPHMQGPELASKVAERRPDIKVLFTTGYFAGAPRSAIGAEEHMLKKPFTAATLLAKVDELVDHRLVGQ